MDRRLFRLTLAGVAALFVVPSGARAGGPAPACAHGQPCASCVNPCAQYFRVDRLPLPPIAFSRYAENCDYACAQATYGDGAPKHAGMQYYWYGFRQPYPVLHSALRDSTPPHP